jgi:hypothetical protein
MYGQGKRQLAFCPVSRKGGQEAGAVAVDSEHGAGDG